jgi:hypothetical protein
MVTTEGGKSGSVRLTTRRKLVAMMGILTSTALAGSATAIAECRHHWGWNDCGGGGGGDDDEEHHCFLKGTQIRTPDGERRIEDLRTGDLVTTVAGEAKPIRRVWHQRHKRRGAQRWSRHIVPIRIARSALGQDIPCRDLFLSPGHALYLDGVLVGAMDLVNQLTISRHNAEALQEIEYFHLKLDRHDVIYAEGAACETMRVAAENAYLEDDYERVAEGLPVRLEESCAPLMSYYGGRGMLRGRLRSVISPLIDMRTRLDALRDELEERALSLSPAQFTEIRSTANDRNSEMHRSG